MVGIDQANFFLKSNNAHQASKVSSINANNQHIPANTIPKTFGLLGPQATTASLGFGTQPANNLGHVVTATTAENLQKQYGTTVAASGISANVNKENYQNGLSFVQLGTPISDVLGRKLNTSA
jgi:hypothetical protein